MFRYHHHEHFLSSTAVIVSLLAALVLVAASGAPAPAHAGPPRSISGSTVAGSALYQPNSTNTYRFTATNASPDSAWLDQVQLTFPAGWTVTSASGNGADPCGNAVSFSTAGVGTNQVTFTDNDGGLGEISDGCSWGIATTVNVPATTGNKTLLNWALSSDGTGSAPHDISGSFTLYQLQNPVYLPLALRNAGMAKYAVVIGISDYPDPVNDLTYPDDDAIAFRQELIDDGGFSSANINLLLNSDATKSNIQNAITSWLESREDEDDLVVIFFAGHGTRGTDIAPIDEADGLDECLATYSSSGNYIRDDELDTWLDALDSQHVVVVIDSCFSGGFIGAGALGEELRCRCLPPLDGARGEVLPGDSFARDVNRSGRLVLTASSETQSSWESSSLGHGVFTYYLLQALDTASADARDGNGWISGEEAHDYLAPRVDSYVFSNTGSHQNPQRSDGIAGEVDLAKP